MALGICLIASALFLQFVLQIEDNTAAVILIICGSILVAKAHDEKEKNKERKEKIKDMREAAKLKRYLEEEAEDMSNVRRAA